MKVSRTLVVAVAAALVAIACDRTPPEPIVATAEAKPKANRCMRALKDPPPPPASSAPNPACPADPTGSPTVPIAILHFPEATSGVPLETEIMASEENRSRGLMFRKEMAEDHGMLFVFADDDERTFWMRNTCISLDMMFVAADGFITGILENVRAPLKADISGLDKVAGALDATRGELNASLKRTPFKLKVLARTGSYGSWFNFYVCGLEVRLQLLQGTVNLGTPAVVTNDRSTVCGGGIE